MRPTSQRSLFWNAVLNVGMLSSSGTVGAFLQRRSLYAAAAYILRGPLRIDLGMERQRDALRYVSVTLFAALGAALIRTEFLVADGTITMQ